MKIDPKILADARARVDGDPGEVPLVASAEQTVAAMVVLACFIACAVILVVAAFLGGA